MVLRTLYLAALSLWFGGVAFFSFGVAPSLFAQLPVADAGTAIATIFPVYYAFGYACGALVLVLGLTVWRDVADRRWRGLHAVIAAAALTATLVAGIYIQPRVRALRPQLHQEPPVAGAKAEFDWLHRLSVQLNGGVLLGCLVLIAGAARRLGRNERLR